MRAPLHEPSAELVHACLCFVVAWSARPGVEDPVVELAVVVQRPDDHVDLADDQLEHVDLGVQDVEQVRLDRVAHGEVVDEHLLGLPNPAHAADPLLDPHGVPRDVVVHHAATELKIAAFAADLRRDEDARGVAEARDGRLAFVERHAAGEGGRLDSTLPKGREEALVRPPESREDDRLFVVAAQEIEEPLLLCGGQHGRRTR